MHSLSASTLGEAELIIRLDSNARPIIVILTLLGFPLAMVAWAYRGKARAAEPSTGASDLAQFSMRFPRLTVRLDGTWLPGTGTNGHPEPPLLWPCFTVPSLPTYVRHGTPKELE